MTDPLGRRGPLDGIVVADFTRVLAAVCAEVENTVDYLRAELGEDAWAAGMNPDLPSLEVLDNPYQYTDFKTDETRVARNDFMAQ